MSLKYQLRKRKLKLIEEPSLLLKKRSLEGKHTDMDCPSVCLSFDDAQDIVYVVGIIVIMTNAISHGHYYADH
jgi:hypothetical protein